MLYTSYAWRLDRLAFCPLSESGASIIIKLRCIDNPATSLLGLHSTQSTDLLANPLTSRDALESDMPPSESYSGTLRVASTTPPSPEAVASNPAQEVTTQNTSPSRLNLTVPELREGHQSPSTSPLNLIVSLELPESPPKSTSTSSPFSLTLPSKLFESPPSPTTSSPLSMLGPSEFPELADPDPQLFKDVNFANNDEMSPINQIMKIGSDALLAYDALLLKAQHLRSAFPHSVPVQGVAANREDEGPLERALSAEDGESV